MNLAFFLWLELLSLAIYIACCVQIWHRRNKLDKAVPIAVHLSLVSGLYSSILPFSVVAHSLSDELLLPNTIANWFKLAGLVIAAVVFAMAPLDFYMRRQTKLRKSRPNP